MTNTFLFHRLKWDLFRGEDLEFGSVLMKFEMPIGHTIRQLEKLSGELEMKFRASSPDTWYLKPQAHLGRESFREKWSHQGVLWLTASGISQGDKRTANEMGGEIRE